mgnify:FL=1
MAVTAPARTDMANWATFAEQAPELAARAHARLEANRHHLLATLRHTGAPRLSGTEAHVEDGELVVGMMMASRKLDDVRRDPRVEIHTAPLDPELHDSDVKFSGSLVERPSADGVDGVMFQMNFTRVSDLVVDGNELVITVWRPGSGVRTIRRG